MTFSDETLLRVYLGETDKSGARPVYELIVLKARELGFSGATVLRGLLGFGARRHLHSAKLLELSEDLPVVVEIVDTEDRINLFLPYLEGLGFDGIVTLEKVRTAHSRKT